MMCFVSVLLFFFFSSRRRHTRCALVTGVQTCALPIYEAVLAVDAHVVEAGDSQHLRVERRRRGAPSADRVASSSEVLPQLVLAHVGILLVGRRRAVGSSPAGTWPASAGLSEIGRAHV